MAQRYSLFVIKLSFLIALLVIIGCRQSNISRLNSFDVIVYGGTSGGFTSAIQAARMGKTVALIEPSQHIGGMNVEGLGGTDIDNQSEFRNSPAVGGLALEFYRRIAKEYDRLDEFNEAITKSKKNTNLWRFESKIAQKVINEWLAEYSISLFTNERLVENGEGVYMENERILHYNGLRHTISGKNIY